MENANINAASPTDCESDNENNGKESSSTIKQPPWTSTGDKHKDDLNLFNTGSFYDCTFKVSNDVTSESRVS
jgi:hypothetical protein